MSSMFHVAAPNSLYQTLHDVMELPPVSDGAFHPMVMLEPV